MRRVVLVVLLVLVAADVALADSKLYVTGDVFYFVNEDAGVANKITGDTDARGRMHLTDPSDPAGMKFPAPPCSPGHINSSGNPDEVFCERDGSYHGVTVRTGPVEDRVVWKIDDLPLTAEGEEGADGLSGAGAADTLAGGQGNDTLIGGGGDDLLDGDVGDDTLGGDAGNDTLKGAVGRDTLVAGDGDDTVQSSDGYADAIDCGAGQDTAVVDQLDTLTGCEQVNTHQVTPVAGQTGGKDSTAPSLKLGGSTSQKARRRLTVLVTTSEPALIDASGFLSAGGLNTRLTPAEAEIKVGGGGAKLRLKLSKRARRLIQRDRRRHRHSRARVTVSAVDAAGNTSRPRRITIVLR
jgi:Ca2+-binding RTX toxin-like protein